MHYVGKSAYSHKYACCLLIFQPSRIYLNVCVCIFVCAHECVMASFIMSVMSPSICYAFVCLSVCRDVFMCQKVKVITRHCMNCLHVNTRLLLGVWVGTDVYFEVDTYCRLLFCAQSHRESVPVRSADILASTSSLGTGVQRLSQKKSSLTRL